MPELAKQLGHDDGLDRALSRKASSPHVTAQSIADALRDAWPNAALPEESATAEQDLATTESGARGHLVARAQGDQLAAATGSRMEDTF
eukprot:324688-Pyramimonas_sp.AAC.1